MFSYIISKLVWAYLMQTNQNPCTIFLESHFHKLFEDSLCKLTDNFQDIKIQEQYCGLLGKATTCDTVVPEGCHFQSWLLHLQIKSLVICLGNQQKTGQVLWPLHPYGGPGWSSWFLWFGLAQLLSLGFYTILTKIWYSYQGINTRSYCQHREDF